MGSMFSGVRDCMCARAKTSTRSHPMYPILDWNSHNDVKIPPIHSSTTSSDHTSKHDEPTLYYYSVPLEVMPEEVDDCTSAHDEL